MTLRTGLRNSSIGVPMVMMTGALGEMSDGREVNMSASLKRPGEQFFSLQLDEGQAAGPQSLQHGMIEIMHIDAKPGLGKSQDQRNADMTAAADHGEVGSLEAHRPLRRRARTGKIQVHAPSIRAIRSDLLHVREGSGVISHPAASYQEQ